MKKSDVPKEARVLAFFDIGVVRGLNALLKSYGLKIRYKGDDSLGDQVHTWIEKLPEEEGGRLADDLHWVFDGFCDEECDRACRLAMFHSSNKEFTVTVDVDAVAFGKCNE